MATEVIKTIKPSGGDYTSLAGWEAGEQADLVAADEIATAECYSMQDTTVVKISGWTTDATRYIRIYTPASERHDGKFNTSKYYLDIDYGAGGGTAFYVWEDYVKIDGIQVRVKASTGANCMGAANQTASSNRHEVSNCIVTSHASSTVAIIGMNYNTTNLYSVYIWNCVVYNTQYGSGGIGIGLGEGSNLYVYNCTVYNCYRNIRRFTGTVTVKNTASFGGFDDFVGTMTIDYCASDDGDGTNAVTPSDWSTVFEDYTNGDFHLKSTDTDLLGAGTDDPGSGLYSDDIDGETRTSTWDIGADEYVATGGALLQAAVSCAATIASPLTTAITAAASVAASATVAAVLITSILLGGAVSASASTAAALTTEIKLAASVSGSASTSADLTVESGVLLASSVSATAATSAALTTEITCAASVSGAGTTAGALTTEIPLASSVSGQSTVVSDLTTEIALAGIVSGNASTSADLTTEITLASSVSGAVTTTADLEVSIPLGPLSEDLSLLFTTKRRETITRTVERTILSMSKRREAKP